jgi:cell wall-associated NlpC family hydrolase
MPTSMSETIAGYLRRKGSPLARYSNDFVQIGNKYGIDPRFLVAVSGIETSFGKAGSGLANPFGYMSAKRFSGPREVLDRMGRELTKGGGYYSGKNTIDSIGATWAPPGATNDAGGNSGWPAAVRRFYSELGGNPNAQVKGGARGLARPTVADQVAAQIPGGASDLAGMRQATGSALNPQVIRAIKGYSDRARSAVKSGTFNPTNSEFVGLRNSLIANLQQGQQAAQSAVQNVAAGAVPTNLALGLGPAKGAISAAQSQIGVPYSWGGGTPAGPGRGIDRGANTVGFDCSSLMQYAWSKAGVKLPRTTYQQIKIGQAIGSIAQARPGDLLFPHPGHVQMYLGNGQVIEAPFTGGNVRVTAARKKYVAIRRPG